MPVVAVTITTTTRGYSVTCQDCLDWHYTFVMKRNADDAMLGHRILQHSYVSLLNKEVILGRASEV